MNDVKISRPDATKCQHCGNISPNPYQGYAQKKVGRISLHVVRCSKCKLTARSEKEFSRSGYDPGITDEQKDKRQVGKPSECCNEPYEQVMVYHKQIICKKCDFPFFGAHSPVSWDEERV